MTTADGAVLGATKIVDGGSSALRWELVIMGDGFRRGELGRFEAETRRVVEAVLRTPPYDELRAAINVYRVDVASTDSGATDPVDCAGGSGAVKRTYFDATFCGDRRNRRLLVVDEATAQTVAAEKVPGWDAAMVIVNSTVYGGSGGKVAVLSLAPEAVDLALHEFGHSAFQLADEYESLSGCGRPGDADHAVHPPGEPPEPNVTVNTDRATLKWRQLVAPTTPLPTSRNANCRQCDQQDSPQPPGTVGLYEGADCYHCGAYRPEFDCKMRTLPAPYCAVCRRRIRQTLTPLLPPVPPVAATAWGPRRLDLFVSGGGQACHHKWFDGSAWGPSLDGAWQGQGGILLGPPEAVSGGPRRLDVFAVGSDHALYHKAFGNGGWAPSLTGWRRLGGVVQGQPEAVSWGPGRVDVFVVGGHRALYHRWSDDGRWQPASGFERLGGVAISQPHAVTWGPGRLDLFVVGGDRALYHRSFDDGGWQPSFKRLGGELSGEPAVVSWGSGRLDVFVVGPGQVLLHKFWDGAGWQPPQTGWEPLGGALVGSPAAVSWEPGRLDVFHVGRDRAVYHKWFDGSAWKPSTDGWRRLGGQAVGAVSAVSWEPGRLDVFHVGGDRAVYHKWFDGSAWGPSLDGAWRRLGGSAEF